MIDSRFLPRAFAMLASLLLLSAIAHAQQHNPETIVVTAARGPTNILDLSGNTTVLSAEDLAITGATHPYELAVRVPGAWVGRGSGQEHLTAIRSPVLTGAGSCGSFLVMEDNIPTRPAGFCNVNQLFELPTELAQGVEVIRGPANALYGSNGLHGTINVLLPEPGVTKSTRVGLEAGSNEYWRGSARWDSAPDKHSLSAGLVAESDGGYREESDYEQVKAYFKTRHELDDGILRLSLSITDLDQETAGYITGFEAYKDRATRFTNPNPEAFRKAGSQRLSATWLPDPQGDWTPEFRFFLRNSEMEFLQHFLPGQPTEDNGQTSGGFMLITRRSVWNDSELTLGLDTELTQGYLEEFQENPTNGSAFLQATRPDGQHYDYDVSSYLAAVYASVSIPFSNRWELQIGARAEYMNYDYDNQMLDGNTRDDGTPCVWNGNEGCLYSRPADSSDNYFNFAPNVGLLYRFSDETRGFANLTRGFRPPQATELYRLQTPQTTADIDSERLDSFEVGIRHEGSRFSAETVAYYMRKDNFIFRDADGLNISDGKTDHLGLEANLYWQPVDAWYFGFTGSLARHEYRFDREVSQGEVIVKGNRVDTAPTTLASARAGYNHRFGIAELEWAHTDSYYLDAANSATYSGHNLLNARFTLDINENWGLSLRVTNLTDEVYADRGDLFAIPSTTYRYFPGHAREIFAGISWRTE